MPAIPVAPIAASTCSGLSRNPASSRSTRGRGIIDWVVVVDWALSLSCRTRRSEQRADSQVTAARPNAAVAAALGAGAPRPMSGVPGVPQQYRP